MTHKSCQITGLWTPARRAFTLLEMIVAIGIILILLAIAVIGFRALDASASRKETASTLSNLQAMVAELESTAGISRLVGDGGVYGRNERIYKNPNSNQVGNPGDVVSGSGAGDRNRYGPAVARTQLVIARLMQVPKNKTVIGQVSSKRLLGAVDENLSTPMTMVPGGGDRKKMPNPPVLLDGWRNPIIFVPSAGMEGVDIAGNDPVTSSGQRDSPTNRPFWASAGPDGDFTKGEDNIYSFNKQ